MLQTEVSDQPARYLLVWWLCFVAYQVGAHVYSQPWDRIDPESGPLVLALTQLAGVVLAVVAAYLFLRFLRETHHRQLLRASRVATLHPGAVWWR